MTMLTKVPLRDWTKVGSGMFGPRFNELVQQANFAIVLQDELRKLQELNANLQATIEEYEGYQ